MKIYIYSFILSVLIFSTSYGKETQSEKKQRFIQNVLFTFENDTIFRSDGYYTSGIQFLFITRDTETDRENKLLSKIFGIKDKSYHNYSFGIGQKIYTPSDIKIRGPIPDDRPYAGYSYLFLDRNIKYDNNKTDTFGVSIGLTGPSSLAENVQKNVHELIKSPRPRGWDNQLSDEFLFMLSWMRSIELREPESYSFDWNAISKFYTNLGTPFTNAAAGIELRFGWNLENDLLPSKIMSTSQGIRRNIKSEDYKDISYYAFFEAEGGFVLYNTFLDGNISGDRPDISKNIFCYGLTAGLTLRIQNVYIKYSTLFLSKEFKEQDKEQFIFSFTVGYLF